MRVGQTIFCETCDASGKIAHGRMPRGWWIRFMLGSREVNRMTFGGRNRHFCQRCDGLHLEALAEAVNLGIDLSG